MSQTIENDLAYLMELLWYCAIVFLPALIPFCMDASVWFVGLGLLLSYYLMHGYTPHQPYCVYFIVSSGWWAWNTYRSYLDTVRFFKGKPVHTFMVWCALTTLTAFAQVDVLKPPRAGIGEFSKQGHLSTLPERPGKRPAVRRAATTEQTNQRASRKLYQWTKRLLQSYRAKYPEHLHIKTSYLEPENDALFHTGDRPAGVTHQPGEWGGEIAHVHDADGSLRVVLHPEDVGRVVEAGWGERHPLCANNKRWFRLLFHGILEKRLPVPEGLVLAYAPRDEGELQILDTILEAGVWYATRGELSPVGFGAEHPNTEKRDRAQPGGAPSCQCCCMAPRNCTAFPPISCRCVCTFPCAVRQDWEDATNELQEITLPTMMRGGLALLNPHREWSAPDSVTTWGADAGTMNPPPPFEPLSFPEYGWSGCTSVEQTGLLADEDLDFDTDSVEQKQASSKFSRPDSVRNRGGPAASPQSCIDILEGEAIGLSVAANATGGLHPGSTEGGIAALAVGHHWLQYEKEGQEEAEVIMGGDDTFTEDDLF